jgi:hypothetical protein
LVGTNQNPFRFKVQKRGKGGDIALNGTIGFDSDKALLRSQTLTLNGDDLQVRGIYFRDHHGNVRGPTVGGVVGYNGALCSGIGLLQGTDIILFHIYRTEDKVNLFRNPYPVGNSIVNDHFFERLGNGDRHFPTAPDCLLVGFSCTVRACCQCSNGEPGVIFQ